MKKIFVFLVYLPKKALKNLIFLSCILFLLSACNNQSKTLEEKAHEIHEKVLTVDTHTDTPWELIRSDFNLNERHDFKTTRSRVDFVRMKEGGLDAVFFAAFVGQGERSPEAYERAMSKAKQQVDSIHTHLGASTETAGLGFTPEDAYRNEKEGKRTVYIGIENGYPIGSDIKNVEMFFNNGARYITLCHTKNNQICDSSTDTTEHNGLSEYGLEVVREMNRLGIMVDVSHISDSSFYDVLAESKKPVIASHSCARAICDNPRNLNDEMLVKLAENGGVIQMCILSDYVKTPDPNPERDEAFQAIRKKFRGFEDLSDEEMAQARKEWYQADSLYPRVLASVSDAIDHIDHIVKVAGIDHVGIGTDFDGGGGLADCEDVSQMGNLTLEMVQRGYTEEQLKKIWGGNIMRVMSDVMEIPGN